MLNTNVRFRSH